MDNTYTLNGNIIVELGGMQIARKQLDAVKSAWKHETDDDAIDHLINCAEGAFNDLVESSEYIADLQEGGDPYEVVHSK